MDNPLTHPKAGNPQGNNFVTNPGGPKFGGPAAPNFPAQQRTQSPGTTEHGGDKPPGPSTAAEVVSPQLGQQSSGYVGTTPGGSAMKPFRLGG